VTVVIVGGLAFDYCVAKTVLQLKDAGFRVIVNLAAVRGIAEKSVEQAMTDMKQAGAEFAQNADDVKRSLPR